jgi:acyl-coenzyme A synthetase/AMP-(fatty) acid ligase
MDSASRWKIRPVPEELARRYRSDGWWTDDTLAAVVDRSLRARPDVGIHVWSETVPWHSTYGEVHTEALRLVAALREEGLVPGDVVAFQLPNWREAVVSFYALAMGGFVMVPIVHIYGAKEVRFILGQSGARAYISPDRYGHVDYLDIVDGAAADEIPALELHVVVGEPGVTARVGLRRVGWDIVAASAPAPSIGGIEAGDVCVLAYTSGTTSEPKGVMHSSQTLLSEIEQMAAWITPGAPNLMGSPVAHATGMLGAS